jgi:ABC-type transport system involved in multi-copper enzyme maturation permease subunit
MSTQGARKARRGPAFTELVSIFLYLDHRFPVLEASAFLLFSCALLFSSISDVGASSAFNYMAGAGGLSLTSLILVVLILKNASSAWGSEFERGTMQTFLTYPLTRGKVLLARLASSLIVPLGLVTISRFSVVFLISPSFGEGQFSNLLLGFLSSIAIPLMVAAIVVLVVQWAKSGGVPFAIGLVAYFALLIFSAFLLALANNTTYSSWAWVVYFFNPVYALSSYFNNTGMIFVGGAPVPTYAQATELLAGNLAFSLALLVVGVLLFVKRTEA